MSRREYFLRFEPFAFHRKIMVTSKSLIARRLSVIFVVCCRFKTIPASERIPETRLRNHG